MKRRDFLKYSAMGSGSLITTVAWQPQPAEAFFPFPFLGLLIRGAGLLLRSSGFQLQTQAWWDSRYEAMLAQSRLFDSEFRRVQVAELNNRFYNYIAVGRKNSGDFAMSFPSVRNGNTVSTFASPAAAGMGYAAEYMRYNERYYPEQVQKAILPTFKNQDSIASWNQSFSSTSYESIASQDGVSMTYRLRKPGRGGYGDLDIVVDADRTIRIPTVRVNFSEYS